MRPSLSAPCVPCDPVPTQVLELVPHPEVEVRQGLNLRAALAASLLRLPASFSEEDLFAELCGLSYAGDIRNLLRAEDVNKVGVSYSTTTVIQ